MRIKQVGMSLLLALPLGAAGPRVLQVDKARTVEVIGEVGERILPKAEQLVALSATPEPIYVVISSPGGSVAAGEVFVQAMDIARARGVVVKCVVPVYAASMAFVIFAHCSERYALPASKLLFHPAAVIYQGRLTAQVSQAIATDLGQIDKGFQDFFLEVSGMDEDLMLAAYYREHMWSAAEMVKATREGWINLVDDVRGIPDLFKLEQTAGPRTVLTIVPKYEAGQCLVDSEKSVVRIAHVVLDSQQRPWYILVPLPPLEAIVGAMPTPAVDAMPLTAVECPK